MSYTVEPLDEITFVRQFRSIQDAAHQAARAKGFWDPDPNNGERIALMHSELSEALEAYREGNPQSVKIPNFSQAEEELADTVIRILDFAGGRGLDVGAAIVAKMRHNAGRPHKHGKEF